MRKLGMGIWAFASLLCAQSATTSTTFGNRLSTGMDGYGNQLYTQQVTIATEDYEVDTFWSRFFNSDNKKKRFDLLATSATAQLKVEASSACSIAGKGELPSQGCSGQKPFLVNNEAVDFLAEGDTVSLIFQPVVEDKSGALLFSQTDASVLYPLDVGRSGEYYQSGTAVQSGSKQTFSGFFTSLFDFFFDRLIGADFFGTPEIADVRYEIRSPEAEDRRQRYIANIIAGVDQEHRMRMPYKGEPATRIDAFTRLNDPASLIHYAEAKKTTEAEQCSFMFLNLSSEGLMCRIMSGFGMEAWMPFFTQGKVTELDVNTITIDTENALLAAAGKVSGESYQKVTASTDNEKLSFLQQLIKPMATMMEMMKNMMFGSSKSTIVADPVEVRYDLSAKPMTLTLAVTEEGTQVDRFEAFKLTGLRSTYGDSVNACTVKYSGSFFGFGSWTQTFYESKGDTVTSHTVPSTSDKTHAAWITWCQEANDKKGLFDYLTDWSSGGVFNPINWMEGMWSIMNWMFGGGYEITDFKSVLKRGLVLDLKKEPLSPVDTLNTTTIKLINVRH